MHNPVARYRVLLRLSWLPFTFVLLASLTRAAGAQPVWAASEVTGQSATAAPALENYLERDGTLNLPPGFTGSLDARGWTLVSGENEPPRFLPAREAGSDLAVDTMGVSAVPKLPGDERWESGFNLRGAKFVYAVVAGDGSDLYVGGEFRAAGDVLANNIAKWDGSHWSALGNGLDDNVESLAWDNVNHRLYAGGYFLNMCTNPECTAGTRVNHIARWDETNWSSLPYGVYGSTVSALALDDQKNLYVGGEFSNRCTNENCTTTVTANNILKWNVNSSTWSSLSNGLNGKVRALALWSAVSPVGNNVMVAGGDFTATAPFPITNLNYLAYWNGSSWMPFWSGVDAPVMTLALDPASGSLVVGGGFNNICDPPSCGTLTRVNHIAVAWANLLYWGPVGLGVNNWIRTLAIDSQAHRVYAGGTFTGLCTATACSATTPASHIAVVDYSAVPFTWSALGSGTDSSVDTLALQGSNLYAGGYFEVAGGLSATMIAKWTPGSPGAWSALNSGNGVSSEILAVAADSAGNVYVGGGFRAAGGVIANRIARWNSPSHTWSALGFGVASTVAALALDKDDNLFVGGFFANLCSNQECAPGTRVNNIAKWTPGANGAGTWSSVDHGVTSYVTALTLDQAGNLYVGGHITGRCPDDNCTAPTPAHGLLKWTRATNTLASFGAAIPSGSTVDALIVDGTGALYVAGVFSAVCADSSCSGAVTKVNRIAKWTASGSSGAWSLLGKGVNDRVLALAVDHSNRLYVGGNFKYTCTTVDVCSPNLYLNGIGLWTPSGSSGTWSSLHNGVSDVVRGLAVDDSNHLFVTGDFQLTCDNEDCTTTEITVNHIAKWDGNSWSALGSGLRTEWYGRALAYRFGILSVVGDFDIAGGKPSAYFARYFDNLRLHLPLVAR